MASLRAKRTLAKLVENGGKASVSKLMLEAGYSPSYAKNPQKLTRSKSWAALADDYIPEEKILRRLGQNLDSASDAVANVAIDLAIKVRNRYPSAKIIREDPLACLTPAEITKELERRGILVSQGT